MFVTVCGCFVYIRCSRLKLSFVAFALLGLAFSERNMQLDKGIKKLLNRVSRNAVCERNAYSKDSVEAVLFRDMLSACPRRLTVTHSACLAGATGMILRSAYRCKQGLRSLMPVGSGSRAV